VRFPFLLKALNNIKLGRCMKESISIVMNIVRGYNIDMEMYSNTHLDDIDEEAPETDNVEEVKDLAFSLHHQLNIVNFLI
jgi:hypothetical protein